MGNGSIISMNKEIVLYVGDFVYIKINDEYKYKQIKMIHKLNNRYELEFERTLKRYPLISDMVIGLNPKLKNSFLIDELLKLNLNVTESIEDLYLIGRITNITRYKKEKTKLSYDTVGVHINVNNYLYKYK